MRWRPVMLGLVSGLVIGVIIGALRGPFTRQEEQTAPLGEDHGQITRVVMQYQPTAGPLVAPIYAQFLTALGRTVDVVWVVGKRADLDDLRARLGSCWPAGHCRAVVVGKEITTWAKDRFVALATPDAQSAAVLCAPGRTRSPNPLRTNDQEVPFRLAREARRYFAVRGTEADFDGGDFLATTRHLFAGPSIIDKNQPGAGSRFRTTGEFTDYLNRKLSRNITWVGATSSASPPHHLGMFLTVMGHTAAVGDVRLAEEVAAAHPETLSALQVAGGAAAPAFCANLRIRLDSVARQMQSLGYAVVRVPLLPSATPRAWMSYNNGIVETRGGKTIFYMPTFGAKALDAAAAATFRRAMPCTVIPIDCAKIWQLGGSLHCLVNVVARKY